MITPRRAPDEQAEAQTVLIVDDEPAIVDLLAQVLEDEGFQVERAGDGRAALARIRELRPDLVIADVMMPRMNGFELIDALASSPDGMPPVILMSAAVVSRREGVPFIAKPFDLSELLDLVNSHLE